MISRRDAWTAYLLMVCQGFLFYTVGYVTPYVESELGAPTWASALPTTAMAVGLLAAAALVPRVVHAIGESGAVRLWAALLAIAAIAIAASASLPALLAGALVIGVAGAGSLTHAVTTFAGHRRGVLLIRATLASVVGGVAAPLVLSAAARSVGWNLGVLAPVPLALALVVLVRSGRDALEPGSMVPAGVAHAPGRRVEPPLGRAYWLAWTFLALCVAAESSFVAWGAQVAVVRTGIELADATALGSLFVVGMVTGRLILGLGAGSQLAPRRLLAAMAALAVAGGLLVWLGSWPVVTGLGLLAGGLGMAGVWATAAGVAVAAAPGSPVVAGARLNLATGGPMLVAPLLLGVVAGVGSVLVAWGAVIALLLAALAVLRLVRGSPAGGPVASRAYAGSQAPVRRPGPPRSG
jgi:hypothetical protein